MNEADTLYDEMNKLANFMDSLDAEKAIAYLIEAQVFPSEDACIKYLSNYPTVAQVIEQLSEKSYLFPGFDQEFCTYFQGRILDSLLTKAVKTEQLDFQYLDLISIKCNFLNEAYEYEESNWYLAHRMLPKMLGDIEQTLKKFPFDFIEDMGDLYVTKIFRYYLDYIKHYAV